MVMVEIKDSSLQQKSELKSVGFSGLAVTSHCSINRCCMLYKPGKLCTLHQSCGRNDIWHKNTFGCMAGLTLALICVAAAGLLVVIQ